MTLKENGFEEWWNDLNAKGVFGLSAKSAAKATYYHLQAHINELQEEVLRYNDGIIRRENENYLVWNARKDKFVKEKNNEQYSRSVKKKE